MNTSHKDAAWDQSTGSFHGVFNPGGNQSPASFSGTGDHKVVHLVDGSPNRRRQNSRDLAGAVAIDREESLLGPSGDGSLTSC